VTVWCAILLLQVGSGMNDEELERLNNHLQPLMEDSPPGSLYK
jgi:ATP-dependent DNA ligase